MFVNSIKPLHSSPNIECDFVKKELGNGRKTMLWKDVWIGNQMLASSFPRLFALETNKDCYISDRFDGHNWSWAWRHDIKSGREYQQLQDLNKLLPTSLINDDEDKWRWSCNNFKEFVVAQLRHYIDHKLIQGDFHHKTTWIPLVPKKVNLFVWRLLRDCIPNFPNLFARGIDVDTMRCLQCKNGIETTIHIFKNCYLATETRNLVKKWIGFDLPAVSPKELLRWSDGLKLDRIKDYTVKAILFTWWWLIWKARNNCVHNDTREKSRDLFNDLVATSFLWITNRGKKHRVPWPDWVSNPFLQRV